MAPTLTGRARVLLACAALAAAPSGAAGLPSDWVDVRDHGAIGDGVADDTAALVAALAAVPASGGTLYLASGDYLMTGNLNVDRGDVGIVCGANAWLVVGAAGLKLINFRGDHAPGGRAANVAVEGCGFRDPAPLEHVALEESHGIIVHSIDGALLRDLRFVDLGDEAVDIIQSARVALLDSHATGGGAATKKAWTGTFGVTNSGLVEVRNNVIEDNRNGSAIRVDVTDPSAMPEAISHVSITGNRILRVADQDGLGGAAGSAITVRTVAPGMRGLIVTGNEIVEPLRMGVDILALEGGSITAAVVSDNIVLGGGSGMSGGPVSRGAIDLGGTSVGAIAGNVVLDWGAGFDANAGIRIGRGGMAVTGNAIEGPVRHGIRSDDNGTRGNAIVGNLSRGQVGVRGRRRDLVALNKTDATAAVRLPGLRQCDALATTTHGVLTCSAPVMMLEP